MGNHNDYAKSGNLAHDWIRWPCIRVSTAWFTAHAGNAEFKQYETWIFSDCPKQKSRQVFHKSRARALRVHEQIVDNLRRKFKERQWEAMDRK